jgi:hypothetical protein
MLDVAHNLLVVQCSRRSDIASTTDQTTNLISHVASSIASTSIACHYYCFNNDGWKPQDLGSSSSRHCCGCFGLIVRFIGIVIGIGIGIGIDIDIAGIVCHVLACQFVAFLEFEQQVRQDLASRSVAQRNYSTIPVGSYIVIVQSTVCATVPQIHTSRKETRSSLDAGAIGATCFGVAFDASMSRS